MSETPFNKIVETFVRERMASCHRREGTPAFEGHVMIVTNAVDRYMLRKFQAGHDSLWQFDRHQACRVALLHDVIEDTPTTLDDLVTIGIHWSEIHSVNLLTLRPSMSWTGYVEGIKGNQLASLVKVFDMAHNWIDLEGSKHRQRLQKYEATAIALAQHGVPRLREAVAVVREFCGGEV